MSDKIPLVSIGLPVYNGEQYLANALDSILAQDFTNFELIISDNASEDNTQNICLDYKSKDKRICYYRYKKNEGATVNFNRVFKLAKGKYFMWNAYDDLRDKSFVSKCLKVLNEDSTIVLCSGKTMLMDYTGKYLKVASDTMDINSPNPVERYRNIMWQLVLCNALYGLIRRNALQQISQKVPLFKNNIGSDNILLAELSLLGRFYQIPETLFFRRVRKRKENAEEYTKKVLTLMNVKYGEKAIDLPHFHIALEHLNTIQRSLLKSSEKVYLIHEALICFYKRSGNLRTGNLLNLQIKSLIDFIGNGEALNTSLAVESLSLLNEAIFMYPTLIGAQFARAVCLQKLGKIEDAKLALCLELSIHPKHTDSQVLLKSLNKVKVCRNTSLKKIDTKIKQYTLQLENDKSQVQESKTPSMNIKQVYIDIVGARNLQDSSCPEEKEKTTNDVLSLSLMEFDLFKKIVSKIRDDYPQAKYITLGNGGDPLLHPNIVDMIRFAKSLQFKVNIKSDLNKTIDFYEIMKSNPNSFCVNIKGYYQDTYSCFHKEGNIERVKNNMKLLSAAKMETGVTTYLYVSYRMYKTNIAEMKLIKDYARNLGFDFSSAYAVCTEIEKCINLVDDYKKIKKDEYLLPVLLAMEIGKKYKIPCRLLYEQIVLNYKGEIFQCSGMNKPDGKIGNYLDMNIDKIAKKRMSNPICSLCTSVGASPYIFYPFILGLAEEYFNLVNNLQKDRSEQALELYKQGVQVLNNGNIAKTLEIFEEANHIYPDMPNSKYMKAICFMQLGEFKKAKLLCREELVIQPNHKDTQILLDKIIAKQAKEIRL